MRLFALLAIVAAGFVAAFAPAAGGRAVGTGTFTDPALGDPNTPDLTALTITDSPTGQLELSFTLAGMPPHSGLFVFFDTDRNPNTGKGGSEYEMEMTSDNSGNRFWDFTKWDGVIANDWVSLPETPTMGVSQSGHTYSMRVHKNDLGGTTAFTFYAIAAKFNMANSVTGSDRMPDSGSFMYELTVPPPPTTTTTPAPTVVVPWIGKATIAPAARAGQRVTVTFPVTNRDTGTPLMSGTMMCDPQIAGKALPHMESFGNGSAMLRFTIPKTAKGKTLKVNLTIRVRAKTAHTVAVFKVR